MNYSQDDKVMHPGKPEWGLGKVLEVLVDCKIRVFFSKAGEKILSTRFSALEKVEGADAVHPLLDNLKTDKNKVLVRYTSLKELMGLFLSEFQDGFYGDDYLRNERNYKIEAHNELHEILNNDLFEEMLAQKEYENICKKAIHLVNKTNLVFPNEKMSLKDGLNNEKSMAEFSHALYLLLFDQNELEKRFENFIRVLNEIDAGRWTIATYFPFLYGPREFMFMKPSVTQAAADVFSFELDYRPSLNWLTYKRVLDFSNYLFNELIELRPRDMVDVQSFVWCVARIAASEYSKV